MLVVVLLLRQILLNFCPNRSWEVKIAAIISSSQWNQSEATSPVGLYRTETPYFERLDAEEKMKRNIDNEGGNGIK